MADYEEKRQSFLGDVVTMAVESGDVKWFHVCRYSHDPDGFPYAIVQEKNDVSDGQDPRQMIDRGVVAKGLRVIKAAVMEDLPNGSGMVLHNAADGQRLYMHREQRDTILAAYYARESADLDALDALAIIECGLFGAVSYC